MNIFEKASRINLVIQTSRGNIYVNDLWNLPLTSARNTNLDDIARTLHNKVSNETLSFVEDSPKANATDTLALDIVKHVIAVKKEEAKVAREAAQRNEQKQRIMELIAKKKDEALSNQSVEDLEKMLADL